jgi:hypothetical protein
MRTKLPFRTCAKYLTLNADALLTSLLALICLAVVSGCSLGKPASASFASVVIPNQSVDQIQQAAVVVFQEDGWRALRGPDNSLVFQKEGSQLHNIGQNGFVGAHYGAQSAIRFKTEIVDLGAGSHRLQGRVFMVRDAGDSFFEDEHRASALRSGPYQRLLNKVAKRLK